jgi:citrate lyase subunit beta/citryl-CoA lyase
MTEVPVALPVCYLLAPAPLPGADVWVRDAGVESTSRPAMLRLRPVGSTGFESDLQQALAHGIGALMLTGVRDIAAVCAIVERCPLDVLPVIDSAQGLDQVRAIALVPGVARLVFDGRALQRQLAIGDDDGLLAWRAQVVLASRLAGLPPPIDDSAASATRVRKLGFGARICRKLEDLVAARAAFEPLLNAIP